MGQDNLPSRISGSPTVGAIARASRPSILRPGVTFQSPKCPAHLPTTSRTAAKVAIFTSIAGLTAPLLNICIRKCSVMLHTVVGFREFGRV